MKWVQGSNLKVRNIHIPICECDHQEKFGGCCDHKYESCLIQPNMSKELFGRNN